MVGMRGWLAAVAMVFCAGMPVAHADAILDPTVPYGLRVFSVAGFPPSSSYPAPSSFYYESLAFDGNNQLLVSVNDPSATTETIWSLTVTRNSSHRIQSFGSPTPNAISNLIYSVGQITPGPLDLQPGTDITQTGVLVESENRLIFYDTNPLNPGSPSLGTGRVWLNGNDQFLAGLTRDPVTGDIVVATAPLHPLTTGNNNLLLLITSRSPDAVAAVPEPTSIALQFGGLALLLALGARRSGLLHRHQ